MKLFVTAFAAGLLLAAGTPSAAARSEEPPAAITYDASAMDADGKTHVMHLKDVTITYGTMTVRADRALATAGDFKNSRWTLDGNVRINAEPRGNLRSDEAIVEFQDNQLTRATATGNPAEFDQKRADSNLVTHGRADEIVYEVGEGTVRLTNDAWITDGQNDISGPLLVYSLRDERLEATTSPGTGQRIKVTIGPNDAPKPGNTATRPHAAADPGKPSGAVSPGQADPTPAPAGSAPQAAPATPPATPAAGPARSDPTAAPAAGRAAPAAGSNGTAASTAAASKLPPPRP